MRKMYTPEAQAYAPVSYNQFLGANATGAPQTETVRYFNEATGQTRMIPHLKNADGTRGATLYPVPEGFVIQEEAPKEEAKKTTATPTAKVKPVESGDDGGQDDDKTSVLGGARMDVGGKSFAIGYNFDGSITLTDPETMESKNFGKDSQVTKDAKAVTMGQMVELSKLTPAGVKTALVSSVANKLGVDIPGKTKIDDIKKKQKEAKNRLDKTFVGVSTDPTEGLNLEDLDTIQEGLEGKGTLTPTAEAPVTTSEGAVGSTGDLGGSKGVGGIDYSGIDASNQPSGDDDDPGGVGGGGNAFGGLDDLNKGGLAKRKTKPKKMKRGGLASR